MDYIVELGIRIMAVNLIRYIFVSGFAFFIFYVLYKRRWQYAKIQEKYPENSDYFREIGYSLITVFIFGLVGVVIFGTALIEYTLLYQNIGEMGWGYWCVSIVLMIVLHDTYFYWTHRLMHHPRIFKYAHLLHHKSVNPSPWASYAFHPIEGIVEAAVIFPIVFLIPFHPTALMVFLIFMMAYNVYGHLGYELYPAGFHKTKIGKWINTSVNHNLHHKHFDGNYGLYFLCWDRWMGTISDDYNKSFNIVSEKRSSKN